jgi:hypothetical protein
MKNISMTLLAAAAIGAVSLGSASAMPFSNVSAALGESHVQDVRVVCNRDGRCYNTARTYRSARPYYAQRSYDSPSYGSYDSPSYRSYDSPTYYRGSGYDDAPHYGYGGARVGIGPVGVRVW